MTKILDFIMTGLTAIGLFFISVGVLILVAVFAIVSGVKTAWNKIFKKESSKTKPLMA